MSSVAIRSAPAHVEAPSPPVIRYPRVLFALDDRMAVTGLLVVSALVYVAGWVVDSGTLRVSGTFGMLVLGVGTAPFQLVRGLGLASRVGLGALMGFTVAMGWGALMADVRPLWAPVPFAVGIGAVALVMHGWAVLDMAGTGAFRAVRAEARGYLSAATRQGTIQYALALTGTGLWLGSALVTGHVVPGSGGFPAEIGWTWFAGVLLLVLSIASAGAKGRGMPAAVTSLALATTLTPALLYGSPRSESAAKQIKLTLGILHSHHIDPTAGIYQAYSAFFAGNAWLLHLAGSSDAFGLATYWPVLMALVRVAELRWMLGRIAVTPRRLWWAVTLVVLVDCIGADYFSPQSLGYVVVVGLLGLALRGHRRPAMGSAITFFVLLLVSLMLGPEHELSPFIAAGCLLVLALAGQAPRWAFAVVALPAVAWGAFQHRAVSTAFSFSQIFSVSNFAPPRTIANPGLSRQAIVGESSHALLLGLVVLIALAAIGLWANYRTRRAWACVIAAGVGLAFVAINPYGNEGIFRAALFGIPWLAGLASWIPRRFAGARSRLMPGAGMLVLGVGLSATFCLGAYGMDASNVMTRGDYDAGVFFVAHADPGSFILPLGYGDSAVNAPLFAARDTSLTWSEVIDPQLVAPGHPVPGDMSALIDDFLRAGVAHRSRPTSAYFILWSPSLRAYSAEYGLQSVRQTNAWLRLLRGSPRWRIVFQASGSFLFRLVGAH